MFYVLSPICCSHCLFVLYSVLFCFVLSWSMLFYVVLFSSLSIRFTSSHYMLFHTFVFHPSLLWSVVFSFILFWSISICYYFVFIGFYFVLFCCIAFDFIVFHFIRILFRFYFIVACWPVSQSYFIQCASSYVVQCSFNCIRLPFCFMYVKLFCFTVFDCVLICLRWISFIMLCCVALYCIVLY